MYAREIRAPLHSPSHRRHVRISSPVVCKIFSRTISATSGAWVGRQLIFFKNRLPSAGAYDFSGRIRMSPFTRRRHDRAQSTRRVPCHQRQSFDLSAILSVLFKDSAGLLEFVTRSSTKRSPLPVERRITNQAHEVYAFRDITAAIIRRFKDIGLMHAGVLTARFGPLSRDDARICAASSRAYSRRPRFFLRRDDSKRDLPAFGRDDAT